MKVNGRAPQVAKEKSAGAEAQILLGLTARLNSCPDTKHQCGGAQGTRAFPRFEDLSTLSEL